MLYNMIFSLDRNDLTIWEFLLEPQAKKPTFLEMLRQLRYPGLILGFVTWKRYEGQFAVARVVINFQAMGT